MSWWDSDLANALAWSSVLISLCVVYLTICWGRKIWKSVKSERREKE